MRPTWRRVQRLGAVSLVKFSTQDYAYDETHKMANLKDISRGIVGRVFQASGHRGQKFRWADFHLD